MSVLPVGFTQGHQPIAFQRHDEVLLPRLLEVFHVFRGGEPDVGQYPREFQPVLDAGIYHRPHLLILGDLATPLFLTGLDVAIMDRLAHQLEISPAVTHTNRLGLTRVRPSQGGKRPFHLPCPPSLHKLGCRRPSMLGSIPSQPSRPQTAWMYGLGWLVRPAVRRATVRLPT